MDEYFTTFADKLCDYCMTKYVIPYLQKHGYVMSYRASVVSVDSGAGTMQVQRPLDNAVTVPYGASASSLSAGDQCTVFMLGESSNAVVVADGKMNL